MLQFCSYMKQVINIIILFCFTVNSAGAVDTSGVGRAPASAETELEKYAFDAELSSGEIFKKIENFESTLDELKKQRPGQPKQALPFDVFLLLEQVAHRQEVTIKSQAEHLRRLRALLNLVEKYQSKATETVQNIKLKPLSEKEIIDLATIHVREGRTQDTPLFVWERKNNITELNFIREQLLSIENQWAQGGQLRDSNNLKYKKRLLNWWDLKVKLFSNEKNIHTLDVSYLTETFAGFSQRSQLCEAPCRMEFWANDERLNSFYLDFTQVVLVGSYLFFTLADSFDTKTGTQAFHFIDLATFSHSLGEEELPIYRLPVSSKFPLQISNADEMHIQFSDGQNISLVQLAQLSEFQEMGFHMLANMADPSNWPQAVQLGEALNDLKELQKEQTAKRMKGASEEDIHKVMEMFDRVGKELQSSAKNSIELRDQQKWSTEVQRVFQPEIMKSEALQKTLSTVGDSLKTSRRLQGKMGALMRLIVSPKPLAATRAKTAVTWVAKKMGLEKSLENKKGFRHWKWGAALLGGAAEVAVPGLFAATSELAVAASMMMADGLWYVAKGFTLATAQGTATAFKAIYSPIGSLYSSYIEGDRWWKSLTGVSVFTAVAMGSYFIPHILFNIHQARRDLKAMGRVELAPKASLKDKLLAWKDKFLKRQSNFENQYILDIAQAELKKREVVETDKGEVEIPEDHWPEIDALLESRNKGVKDAVEAAEKSSLSSHKLTEYKSLGKALFHFVFSIPAFELNMRRWTAFWNWFVSWRYAAIDFAFVQVYGVKVPVFITPRPKSIGMRLLYPEFFSTLVTRRYGKATVPTELNGGLRPRWTSIKKTWQHFQASRGNIKAQSDLSAVQKFQDQVVDIEEVVVDTVFRESLISLTKLVSKPDELLKILGAKKTIRNLTQAETRDLSSTSRFYLQGMFDQAYGRAMLTLLGKALASELPDRERWTKTDALDAKDLKQIKELWTKKMAEDPHLKLIISKDDIVKEVQKYTQDEALQKTVWKQANAGYLSMKNLTTDAKFNVMSHLDPLQNKSTERYAIVDKKLKDPLARGRAVRKAVTKLLTTFPIDVGLRLLFLAGATKAMYQPVSDNFIDHNTFAFLTVMVFWGTMLPDFINSYMADSWAKMQEDHQNDMAGNFGDIPQGEDAEKGFLRWYWKKFTAKSNSYASMWKMNGKIVFWNFPSYLILWGVTDLIFKPRLDFSWMAMGFIGLALLPFDTMITRLNQAFETAMHYSARGIKDPRWFSVPKVAEMVTKDSQKLSLKFNWIIDIIGTVTNMTAFNIFMADVAGYGPRTLMRSFMGGYTPEELVVNNVTTPVSNFAKEHLPAGLGAGTQAVMDACDHILTNKNADLIRLNRGQ